MCVLLFYTFSGALFPAAYGKRKIFMAIHRGNELFGCELRKINNYCVRFNILKKILFALVNKHIAAMLSTIQVSDCGL